MSVAYERKPLPTGGMYAAMRSGHKNRTGHELDAHLVRTGDELWMVERDCCA